VLLELLHALTRPELFQIISCSEWCNSLYLLDSTGSARREVSPSAGSYSCDGCLLLRAAEAAKEVMVRHHCAQLKPSVR